MSYAKLFSSITESSLWSEASEVRILFVSMLAKADSTGFVEAAVPGLARLSNLPQEQVERALLTLESPDPHSKDLAVNPVNQGRRICKVPGGWMVINYESYRERRNDDERREWMRKYMRQYRKDLRENKPRKVSVNNVNHSKPQLAQAETETEGSGTLSIREGEKAFEVPSIKAVNLLFIKMGLPESEAEKFFAHYEANGWRMGPNPVRSWQAAATKWKCNYESDRASESTKSKVSKGGASGNDKRSTRPDYNQPW